VHCSIEFFFGDVGQVVTFEGKDNNVEERGVPSDPDRRSSYDKDHDKDEGKKGDSEDNESSGSLRKQQNKKLHGMSQRQNLGRRTHVHTSKTKRGVLGVGERWKHVSNLGRLNRVGLIPYAHLTKVAGGLEWWVGSLN
jgi:hypothetical protein